MNGELFGDALAHGLGGRQALPLPLGLMLRGTVVALLASFLGLGLLWRTPRLRGAAAGRAVPHSIERLVDSATLAVLLRTLGLIATGYVAIAALFGRADALNPFPYVVYVLFWVGLVPASLLLGPVWRRLNPLRTLHLLAARLLRRDPARGVVALPESVGYWPAAVSLLSFVWLELAAPGGATVPVVRTYVVVYAAVHLAGAFVFGSRWFDRADGFEVYSGMIGRLAPWGRREDGRIVLRNPLDGIATFGAAPGVVAFVAVCLGSTAFDGLTGSPVWIRAVQGSGIPMVVPATLGLLLSIGFVVGTYGVATLLAGRHARHGRTSMPGVFAHTLIPIIVGYIVAHYLSYLIIQGQQALILLSDPLGTGANWLGTADNGIDYTILAPSAVALIRVIAVVGGHIVAVVSAHDRAVSMFPRRRAVAGQLPMMVLMIGYTVGGLLLLFAA